jgi:hypothetical protein
MVSQTENHGDALTEEGSTALIDRAEAAIRALFAEGLPLTDDVRHYIEATLGAAAPEDVADLLAADGDSEGDTLLELIFFPDFGFQCRLEAVLAGGGLTAAGHAQLAQRLQTEPAAARLVFPEHAQTLACDLPAEGVATFLTRLNLTWALDSRLRESLVSWGRRNADDGPENVPTLTARLRIAALQQSPGQVGLLTDFLARTAPVDPHWRSQLDFLMGFLPGQATARNLYRALMKRKMFLVRHLIKARRTVETMQRSNMETLRMSGFRDAYFDISAAEQELAAIDGVARVVYGRTEHYDDAPVSMDLGRPGGAGDLEDIVRRLM